MSLRCTGTVHVRFPDGSQHEVALADLVFEFIDTFEPSLVLVHNYEAPLPGAGLAVRARVEVVEDATGLLFATLALGGAANLGVLESLGAVRDGTHVELRLPSTPDHRSARFPDQIREAVPSDARAIAQVQVAGWHASYRGLMPDATLDDFTVQAREAKWQKNLAEVHEGLRITVLERDGHVVAYAASGPSRPEPGEGELWALYAAPNAWGTGAGRALLEDALQHLGESGYATAMLRVLAGNTRAIRFYERAGFRTDGPPFEDSGLMALRMRRGLPRPAT